MKKNTDHTLKKTVQELKIQLDKRNRELEVEAALERVRGRAMSMQASSELNELVARLYEEMEPLGIAVGGCELILCNKKTQHLEYWATNPIQKVLPKCYSVPKSVHPLLEKQWDAWRNNKDRLIIKQEGKGKKEFEKILLEDTEFKNIPEETKKYVQDSGDVVVFSHAVMRYGLLEAIDTKPLSEENFTVLHRFSKVFEQTFTRFLDLQKAEGQAREAQIEASLERVRARSMAMYKSTELEEAAVLLYQELRSLGVDQFFNCGYVEIDVANQIQHSWMTHPNGSKMEGHKLPLTGEPVFDERYKAWKKKKPVFHQEASGSRLQKHNKAAIKFFDSKEVEEMVKAHFPNHVHFYCGNYSHGYLCITTESIIDEEAQSILGRFTKIFEQTYTRFLDLQKAEAQAREAQIEAALERVRASTMAMHKSEELFNTVNILYLEIAKLGFTNESTDVEICIIDESDRVLETWSSEQNFSGSEIKSSYVGLDEVPVLNKQFTRWFKTETSKRKTLSLDFDAQGKEWKGFVNYMAKHPDWAEAIKVFKAKKINGWFWHHAYHRYGSITIQGDVPVSQGIHEIMRRFSNVFEQTYTRFLDLQKAESQAREAQIEAALEKVRSRTMAMQRSEELLDVATILFQQVKALGVPQWNCGFNIWEIGDKEFTYYPGSPDGEIFPSPCNIPLNEHPVFKRFDTSRKKGEELLIYEKQGPEQVDHYNYMLSLKGVGDLLRNMVDAGFQFPEFQIDHIANFSYGNLIFITYEHFPEMHDVFKRFAKVFEQTYTRFLDLQKAEGQAREAQIEAALERVRARTMAMHKSDELSDAALVLYNELKSLGISRSYNCGYVEVDEEQQKQFGWMSNFEGGEINGFVFPLEGDPIFNARYKAWKERVPVFQQEIKGEVRKRHLKFALPFLEGGIAEMTKTQFPDPTVIYCCNFSHGYLHIVSDGQLSDQEEQLLIRFTQVFEQTYTRFLDLKKAEAQAREAQIESALERVRSRSMAMHKSDELNELIGTVFTELTKLDLLLTRSILMMVDPDSRATRWWMANSEAPTDPMNFLIPNHDHPAYLSFLMAWGKKNQKYEYVLKGNEKTEWDDYLFVETELAQLPVYVKEGMKAPDCVFISASFHKFGCLSVASLDPLSTEHFDILIRFAKVFEQTYTRFLDLQKAEAQARKAQIEAALERVRTRTMAMHQSEELADVIDVVFKELKSLGFQSKASDLYIIDKETNHSNVWISGELDHQTLHVELGMMKNTHHLNTMRAWKNGEKIRRKELNGKHCQDYMLALVENDLNGQFPEHVKDFLVKIERVIHTDAYNKYGFFRVAGLDYLSIEEEGILIRFTRVFEQTFTRFLDLQNAEAQAREAQIEAALERVRSRSMAMHKSEELAETAVVLFQQLNELGVKPERLNIGIVKDEERIIEWWSTEQGGKQINNLFKGSIDEQTTLSKVYLAWQKGDKSLVLEQSGRELTEWLRYLKEELGLPFKEELRQDRRYQSTAFFTHGMILLSTPEPLSEETLRLLPRFAKVFEQSYTRFLDLQKAEAQGREAQIETALERIRAKALAMQTSDDLHEVSIVLREQMGLLGQPDLESSIVHLYNNRDNLESWYTFRSTETDSKKVVTDVAFIPTDSCDYIIETLEKYKSKETEYTIVSKGKKLRDWYKVMVKVAPDTIEYDNKGKMVVPKVLYYHHSKFSGGALLMISNQPPSLESKELQRRAAHVFNFAYQRFLDLKKAEERAREAKIDASLERVRAQAMAMQHSDDLVKCTTTLFEELAKLELSVERSGIGIFDEETRDCQLWTTVVTAKGGTEIATGITSLTVHPMLIKTFDAWKSQVSLLYVLEGKELEDYYRLVSNSEFHLPDEVIENSTGLPKEYYLYTPFGAGGLYFFSDKEISIEEQQIIRRFADVFHLSYTRYEDLQKAEARALEAIKQASLDRVRAEIASMRTTEDLNRITPLVWKELTALGIPFIRCGVLIIDEKNKLIQSYLSDPEGYSLGVFDLPFDSEGIATGALGHWKKGTIYKDHWNKEQFLKFSQSLIKHGQVKDIKTYQGADKPPEFLDLHFVPFKQGMLYVGNNSPLVEGEIQLVKSLAEAFSIAYARYEDFTQLEVAKNQIQHTLDELKSTQTQLVHSEKMASLGELTAGIAHEIQNPLNFVNNFSDVSIDLIAELREEKAKGKNERNEEFEDEILDDVIENLGKINHHGQRASSIVRGMLEHSRAGNREKELTDLNVLADEYLRLSYHGLRAKDKSFNADFKVDLDAKLPKVNVMAQDIGRVLLNMINNAFYACSHRGSSAGEGYKPEVIVSTKFNDKTAMISVIDNGGGIPKGVVDKIFQPFFTTKPTGQGTGLGLSLSYDIVTKGHDGHLEVETEEGIGTRFTINLPIKSST